MSKLVGAVMRLLDLGARAQELDVEFDPEVLLGLCLGTGRPLDAEADHPQGAGVRVARLAASGLRGRRAGEGSAGRECCRAEASLDQQFTPRHAPPPRLRALGPDDIRIRVVPTPELVRVSQLIRVLLGIEPEIFEVTHATSPFSSRREAVWLRPTAGMRWIGTKGRRVPGSHAPRPTWLAPIHPVIAHAARSLPKAVEPEPS